ncbi:MAG: autotransporter outer membrane beta-barrel domain-containing protein, partial [Pseudomonadota bacterium]
TSKAYTILQAGCGVTGRFSSINTLGLQGTSPFYGGALTYTGTEVLLTVEADFSLAGLTGNEGQVVTQLSSLTDPTSSQLQMLNALLGLNVTETDIALSQMAGEPHVVDLLQTEYRNRQFLRKLSAPLYNQMMHRDELGGNKKPTAPGLSFWSKGSAFFNSDAWSDLSVGRSMQPNDGDAYGYNSAGYSVTLGTQKEVRPEVTVGGAAAYDYDLNRYHVGGSGTMNTVNAGLYGLYRPEQYYVFADLAVSYTHSKLNRPINLDTLAYSADSTAKITQAALYVETARDLTLKTSLPILIQPFVGFELGSYWQPTLTETGAGDLDLIFENQHQNRMNTRMGTHMSFQSTIHPNTRLDVDLAWQYRWAGYNDTMTAQFSTFGSEFTTIGLPRYRSTFDGAVRMVKTLNKAWNVSGEVASDTRMSSTRAKVGVTMRLN